MTTQSSLNLKLKKALINHSIDIDEVEAAISEGADPKSVCLASLVSAHGLTSKAQLTTLDILIKRGADLYRDRGSALSKALGHTLTGQCDGDDAVLDLLLQHQFDVNINEGINLRWAIESGRLDRIKKLVAHGGQLSLLGRQHGFDAISSATGKNSHVELLIYCLDQVKSELTPEEFDVFCNKGHHKWICSATRSDRPDLIDELVKRFKLAPPTYLFVDAAKNAALKTMDYVLSFEHPDPCTEILTDIVCITYSAGDPQKYDALFAPVLLKILSIKEDSVHQSFDQTIPSESIEKLAINGCSKSLKVLADHNIVNSSWITEAEENRIIAKQICDIAENHGFSVDNNSFPCLSFSTRDNAMDDASPGQPDIDSAIELVKAIRKKFPQINVTPNSCDEWVHVDVQRKTPEQQAQNENESGIRL